MPVERHAISVSQFCNLLEIDPHRFLGVEFNRQRSSLAILIEPEDSMGQTTGAFPALSTGKKAGGKKGGGKRGC